jgi:hypothetical protein
MIGDDPVRPNSRRIRPSVGYNYSVCRIAETTAPFRFGVTRQRARRGG